MILEVLDAPRATVQDLGRRRAHEGLATGGALDQDAARAANALVGNPAEAPLAELLLGGATVRVDRDALVAVTGAPSPITVGGLPAPMDRSLVIPAGAVLRIGAPTRGTIAVLAVAGVWDVPRFAGSAAPDPALGVGTALAAGMCFRIDGPDRLTNPVLGAALIDAALPVRRPGAVPLLPGPDLTPALERLLPSLDLVVDPRSDHVGVRLTGAVPAIETPPLLSHGVAIGAVEVPAAGGLIALQRGRVLTAGYPVAGVVPVADQWRIAQAAPGDVLRFRWTTEEDAVARLRTRRTALAATTARVRIALDALAAS